MVSQLMYAFYRMFMVVNPIRGGMARSDILYIISILEKSINPIDLNFRLFLNNHFEHFKFSKNFLGSFFDPYFECSKTFSPGLVRFDLPCQILSFQLREASFMFFHTISNFQQLLIQSLFCKVIFKLILGQFFNLEGVVISDQPTLSPYKAKYKFMAIGHQPNKIDQKESNPK